MNPVHCGSWLACEDGGTDAIAAIRPTAIADSPQLNTSDGHTENKKADTRQSTFFVVHKKNLKILDTRADIAVIANRRLSTRVRDLAALPADGRLDENKK